MTVPNAMNALATERAWIEIDTDAIAHNIRALQSCLKPGTDLLAVVKADALQSSLGLSSLALPPYQRALSCAKPEFAGLFW
jgi:hypothetical protein